MNHTYLFFFILLSFACKVKKEVQKEKIYENKTTAAIVKEVKKNSLDFNTVSAKANVEIIDTTNKKKTFKIHLRIKKDSIIWLSITPMLGIEAARIIILKDSIKFIDRINKKFYIGHVDDLFDNYNIDIDLMNIQSILLNSMPIFESNEKIRSYNYKKEFYVLSTTRKHKYKKIFKKHKLKKKENDILISITVSKENFKIVKFQLSDFENKSLLEVKYDEFTLKDTFTYPQKMYLTLIQDNNNLKINWQYIRFNINKEIGFPFKIPEKFEKIY